MSQEDEVERAGIRIGTPVRTKFMERFSTGIDSEGRYMIVPEITVSRIATAARFIGRTGTDGLIVCSGESRAETPTEKFCEAVGARRIKGRFMPGTLTNPSLSYYIEPRLVLVTDPHVDGQAITEATNAGIPVIGIANTGSVTSRLDVVIPANNKGVKALAAVFWLLASKVLEEGGGGEPGDMKAFETVMDEDPE